VDRETAERDVMELVEGLAGCGVLRVLDQPLAREAD